MNYSDSVNAVTGHPVCPKEPKAAAKGVWEKECVRQPLCIESRPEEREGGGAGGGAVSLRTV